MSPARRMLAGLLCALSGALALAVPSAGAEMQVFQSSFDGAGSSAGAFTHYAIGPIGIDQADGVVYVRDRGPGGSYGGGSYPGLIHRFDLEGNAAKFPGSNSTTISAPVGYYGGPGYNPDRLSVDNTGTATQGNFYLNTEEGGVFGFDPSGEILNANFPLKQFGFCGVVVAPDGTFWVNEFFTMTQFTAAGTPTGAQVPADGCQSAFDADGNAYVYSLFNALTKYDGSNGLASLGGIGDTGAVTAIAVDPTTKDVYVAHKDFIQAYRYSNPLVPGAPFETLTGFQTISGLAFDAEGNLYVAEMGIPADPTSTKVDIFRRQAESAPIVKKQSASKVRSTSAYVNAEVVAAGSDTSVHFEYGTDSSYGNVLPEIELGNQATPFRPSAPIEGLSPNTTYHYRVVATNDEGTTPGPDRSFTTYPTPPGGSDPCPNALVRQQTGARALLDCRAYELVSARNTGGSDVESSLVPGQLPYGGYPHATDRVLYALHAGALPDPGQPTNRGPDPYLATRGADGWSTRYVGIPANVNDVTGPFSSTLAEASPGLDAFAFGGKDLCDPCFTEGIETGLPVRTSGGDLIQGMAGSLDPGATAAAEGHVGRHFSADGTQLVFGSRAELEPDANDEGDVTIYSRDLGTGLTKIVSKTPGGTTMGGGPIAALDLSDDGSRVIVAREESVDPNGNSHWRMYMNIGGAPQSVDLTPGAGEGVRFDGMTADGSRVFFTSPQALVGSDADTAPDVYEAAVAPGGSVSLRLVSVGSGSCNPVANGSGSHWNSVGATADCGAVAIGGGAGVARQSGAVYYLSPEALGGGVANQPNLYAAPGDGSAPRFVATLSPDDPVVVGSVHDAEVSEGPELQVAPSGRFATFRSVNELTGVDNAGNRSVFLYDDAASGSRVTCPSCNATLTEDPGMKAEATLATDGLSLTDDGRVFFNTEAPLATEDTGGNGDVYEWVGGRTSLISSGIGRFDSELLTATHDGTDAYFFTHDTLDANVDENGDRTRIYDARVNGGFFKLPVKPQCAASDECHGPGTVAPGPPQIASSGRTSDGNRRACPKGKVKRKGKCVKKKRRKKHAQQKRGGGRNG